MLHKWRRGFSTTPSVLLKAQRPAHLLRVFSVLILVIFLQFAFEASSVCLQEKAFVCARPPRQNRVGRKSECLRRLAQSCREDWVFWTARRRCEKSSRVGCTDTAADWRRSCTGLSPVERRLASALKGQDVCVLSRTSESEGETCSKERKLRLSSLWRETRVPATAASAEQILRRHFCVQTPARALVYVQPTARGGNAAPVESFFSSSASWETPLIWSSLLLPPSFPEKHKLPLQKTALILAALQGRSKGPHAKNISSPFLPFGQGFGLASPVLDFSAVEEAARLAHSAVYVHLALRGGEAEAEARLEKELGVALSDHWRIKTLAEVSCSILSAQIASEVGLSLCVSGGLHHAGVAAGRGYCLLNDTAIAARVALLQKRARRVLILDLDVHQGDGTAEIFRDDPRVFTLSIHCEHNYPKVKAKSDKDVSLPSGTGDATYLKALDEALTEVLAEFRPDLVLYNAGVDVHQGDRIGLLRLSDVGLRTREEIVFEKILHHNQAGGRAALSCVVGGGYSWEPQEVVDRHLFLFETARDFWYSRRLREVYVHLAEEREDRRESL